MTRMEAEMEALGLHLSPRARRLTKVVGMTGGFAGIPIGWVCLPLFVVPFVMATAPTRTRAGNRSQLKHRLRPMRGPRTDRSAQIIIADPRSCRTCDADTTNSASTPQPAYP
jgi:hypothetical protein